MSDEERERIDAVQVASAASSIRSSIDSSASKEFLPETLVRSDDSANGQQRVRSRRYSTSSGTSRVSRISTRMTTISSMVDSVRDDNAQTAREERRVSDAAVLRREYTLTDALSKIDSQLEPKNSHEDEEEEEFDEEDLDDGQEKNKNLGYTKEDLIDPPPDGGLKAWGNAVCVGLLSFSTWGINSAFGVFLSYYSSSNYFPGANSYDFALVGSIVVGVSQLIAPFVIVMMKYVGFRQTLILGTILQTASYILASFSTKLWQLFLTQGLMTGISFALIFCPATMIIPTWFLHKRGFANGIGLCGSGLGGVVFSLSINKMIETTGNQKWALRMLAIIGAVICVFCIIFTSPRNYKKPKTNMATLKVVLRAIFDMTAWKEPATLVISVWLGIANMAYTIVLFSISSYAVAVGLTAQQASVLTSLLNAGQTIGRPMIGLCADKFGRINFALFGMSVAIILIFAFWLNARTYASLIVFTFISGFFVPIANTLNQALMADAIEPSRFPAAFALVFIFLGAFAFPSEVIGMKLVNLDNKKFPYLYCQIFAGAAYFVSASMLLPLREIKIKKMVTNRTETTQARLNKINKGDVADPDSQAINEEIQLLERRLDNYDRLLQPTLRGYISRTFYPIKA